MVASSAEDFTIFATALGVQGVSITIPYKVGLFERADDMDDLSRRVGAVNTYRRDALRWEARNTDVSGFLAPLSGAPRPARRARDDPRRGRRGAGGCRGARVCRQLSDGVRQESRQSEGCREAGGGNGRHVSSRAEKLGPSRQHDAGRHVSERGGDRRSQASFDGRIVYDLVYNPMDTRLLKDAAAAGCETIGGLDMLVAQAEDQSEWWLGRRPPRV